MSNESKPQEWFYLQNDTWNGPFKTSGLKELVKKGAVGPSTLLRIGVASAPIKASQVKSLFPNYQGDEAATAISRKGKGLTNNIPILIGSAIIIAFVLGLLIFSLFKLNETYLRSLAEGTAENLPRISLADGIASIEKEMVLIPAGRFMMGDRGDRLQVTLTKPFYMGKYEVAQEQWESVMGNNPSSRTKGDKLPVTDVSWKDCQEFIKKLNASTKGGFRLPYEGEWEYACRAGTTTAYSVGDSLTKADANIDGDSTKAVGSYKPNAFGLYDMHGNVWEWCEDWRDDYLKGAVTDPKGPGTGTYRVLRGGSFVDYESLARSSGRNHNSPTNRDDGTPAFRRDLIGFRLVRTADLKAAAHKPDLGEVMPATENLSVSPFSEAKAKEVQKLVAKSLQKEVEEKEDLGKGVKLDLVLVPAGKFKMGSPTSEKGRDDDEKQHEVTLTKPYYMGKYEVAQEQWESVMGNNPSSRTKGDKLPVTNVSWEDCQEFIKKLNAKTNGGYRLPTEAEWEYASRAGNTTAYSVGDSLTKADANIDGDSTKAVGSYKPNAFGLYDMHGNVYEWCEDFYGDYPAGAGTDPKGPATGYSRVLRGGSFFNNELVARSSCRFSDAPTFRIYLTGFRLARTP